MARRRGRSGKIFRRLAAHIPALTLDQNPVEKDSRFDRYWTRTKNAASSLRPQLLSRPSGADIGSGNAGRYFTGFIPNIVRVITA